MSRVRRIAQFLPVAVLALAALALRAPAQSSRPADLPTSAPASAPVPLPDRQAAIRERVQRLEAKMLQLAQFLAETEPQQAERLRDALQKTRENRIETRLDQLVASLRAARFSDAEREQAAVISDLESVLTLLTNPANRLDERRREREALEARRRAVRALLDEQQQHLYRTQMSRQAEQYAEQVGKLADELEKLAERQEQLRNERGDPKEHAEKQAALERQVREAEEKVEKLAQANEDPNRASGLRQAEQDAKAAASAMHRAAENLDRNADAQETAEQQRVAQEDLHRAVRRLRDQQEQAKKDADAKAAEDAQRATQKKADELQKDMKSTEGKPSPGTDQVEQAARRMQRAADDLGEQRPENAGQEQKEAISELQKAVDELENALRQVRQEEQEETLAAIESRLRGILAREEAVSQLVIELDAKGAGKWQRADELRLSDAAAGHGKALEESQAVLRILTEEGTTVIVPELIKDAVGDMEEIAVQLAKPDTGSLTRAAIADVISLLKEILGAVERKRDQNANNQQNGGQQQSGQQPSAPLLPRSAELRLLRSSQIRLNERTATLAGEADANAAQAAEYDRLSARQRELGELTRRMNERGE